MYRDMKSLADSLNSYKNYLNKKNEDITYNHTKNEPCKSVAKDATVEHIKKVYFVSPRYTKLDKVMCNSDKLTPVFFDGGTY
jgi:deoxycytidylate deaminase